MKIKICAELLGCVGGQDYRGQRNQIRSKKGDCELLDRQSLGLIRLELARNVAFNIANEKTTADLMRALSNMYKKPACIKRGVGFLLCAPNK